MRLLIFVALSFVVLSCRGDEEEVVKEGVRESWPITRGGVGLSGQVGVALSGRWGLRWMLETEGAIVGEAVVENDLVVFGNSAGFLMAVGLETGRLKWQREFEQSFEAAPAIQDGVVFIGCEDGCLYALDLKDGETRWKVETDDKITAGVNVTRSPSGEGWWVILNGYDGVCRALKASDGSLVWKHETGSPINGTPAVVEGKFVIFGGCDHVLYTLDLATGVALKTIQGEAPIVSTVGTEGNFVAWGDHSNCVMGASLGDENLGWRYHDRNFPFMAAPAVDKERVYIGGRDKRIHAISRESGEGIWKFKTGGRVESSPIIFSNALVCGSSDGRVYALGLEEGELLWKVDLGEPIVAAPSYAGGIILVGGEDGTLFALGKK